MHAIVYTREIPGAWMLQARQYELFDEPARCAALMLKVGDARDTNTYLLFAAPRIAWYPDRVNERLAMIEASREITSRQKEACLGLIRVVE